MKKVLTMFFIFCATVAFAYPRLWTGTYALSGGNSKWGSSAYQGEVTIQPQGENFQVVWKIGAKQSQVGIGILYNGILSVSYTDSSSGDWGVASFRLVSDGELEGRWTSYSGTSQKPEYLVWKGH